MANHIWENETSARSMQSREMTHNILLHHFSQKVPKESNSKIPSFAVYTKARHREKCKKYDISHNEVINGINAAVKDSLKIKASLSHLWNSAQITAIFSYLSAFFPL